MKAQFKNLKATKAIGNEGKWINASDHLPEPEVVVAVLTATGQTLTAECSHNTTRAEFTDGKWQIAWYMPVKDVKSKQKGQPHHARRITHWMPFPASPLQLIESKE
jgi:hypothetical protein